MKILLYGGSGFLGRNLSDYYSQKDNVEIIVVSRSVPDISAKNTTHISWEFFQRNMKQIILTVDTFVYLVSQTLPRQDVRDINTCISFETNALETVLQEISYTRRKIKFVYFSSGGAVYGKPSGVPFQETDDLNPITAYGIVKRSCEEIVMSYTRQFDFPTLVLRPSNIYGKYQSTKKLQGVVSIFSDRMLHAKEITIFGDGKSTKDYIYVDDFLLAFDLLLGKNVTGVFNVGSGFEYSVKDIISILEGQLGIEAETRHVILTSPDITSLSLNSRKLHLSTGFSATTNMASGIKSYLGEFDN